MPPIPIYKSSPINANKASGVTPQTAPAGAEKQRGSSPPRVPAQTTHQPTKTVDYDYMQPKPGAVPSMPAPTGSVPGGRYVPAGPAPTQSLGVQYPPAPQPGAVPIPPGGGPSSGTSRTSGTSPARPMTLPPPPKAGDKLQQPAEVSATTTTSTPARQALSQASSAYYPPQMAVPTPTFPYQQQQRGTSTATSPTGGAAGIVSTSSSIIQGAQTSNLSGSGTAASPVSTSTAGVDLGHPPGYQQNVNATANQPYQYRNPHSDEGHGRRRSSNAAGYGGHGDDDANHESLEGVWDAAKKLAQAAGEKLSAAETEVWRRINSKG